LADLASLDVIVSGRVQGVSFRYFVQKEAAELGLVGFVRNLPQEDQLQVSAQGDRLKLEMLLARLRVGPPTAAVGRVEAKWGQYTGEHRAFQIRF
jgi:acylphosphatase